MSQGVAVFIMMNNYFHDVATAMVMALSVMMLVVIRKYQSGPSVRPLSALKRIYRGISGFVIFSWCWILVSGIIRFATFSSYEWPNAVEKHQEYGLMTKYGLAVVMIAAGALLWIAVVRRMRAIVSEEEGR